MKLRITSLILSYYLSKLKCCKSALVPCSGVVRMMCDGKIYWKSDQSCAALHFTYCMCVCVFASLLCQLMSYATVLFWGFSCQNGNVAEGKPEERSGALPSAAGSHTRGHRPETKDGPQEQLQAA